MTKAEAIKEFRSWYRAWGYGKGDKVAIRTMWNDWTDSLCKDGLITQKQFENWGQPF